MKTMRWILAGLLIWAGGALDARAAVSVLGGLTKRYDVKPGGVVRDTIGIRNEGTKPAEVKIYQTDYRYNSQGENYYDNPGSTPRSNAAWIRCTQSRLTVAPGSVSQLAFIMQVPGDAGLSGSYWSMIMIEPLDEEAAGPVKPGMGIRTQIRFAVQVIGNIGASGEKKIQFKGHKLLAAEDGRMFFQSDVENVGSRELTPTMTVEIYDEKGALFGRFNGGKFRIFPSTSVRFTAEVGSIPKGSYNLVVVVDNGDEFVVGDQVKIKAEPLPRP